MLCGHECTLHCDDDVHLEADELGRYLGIALLTALCPAILYPEISSVAPAEFPKPSHKRTRPGAPGSGRARPEEADNWRLKWLLCPRRERPRSRTAEKCDELAAFHCPVPPVLRTERIAHLRYGRRLLRCGISAPLMPESGQSLPIDMTAT